MRKLISQWLFLCMLLCLTTTTFSQVVTEKAMRLIKQNASSLQVSESDIDNMLIPNAYLDEQTGIYRVYAQQSYKGVPVYNAIQVMMFKNEKLVSQSGGRLAKAASKVNQPEGTSAISAFDAVKSAANHLKLALPATFEAKETLKDGRMTNFGKLNVSNDDITTELMWFPQADGQLRLGWQVQISPSNSVNLWLVHVDAATGVFFNKVNLTVSCNFDGIEKEAHANCTEVHAASNALSSWVDTEGIDPSPAPSNSVSYRVIPYPVEAPSFNANALTIVNNPVLLSGAGNNATTLGWHSNGTTDYLITRGNNVWAKEDAAGNNSNTGKPDTSSTPYPDLTFTKAFDFGQEPNINNNQRAATTNLFYWNNIMHDLSYQHGFTEAAGNFQANNLSRGGAGNDWVYADAQDGEGTNNANFGTPADGGAPRMQMFLWSPSQLMTIDEPEAIAGPKNAVESVFSTENSLANFPDGITQPVVYYEDVTGGLHEGCVAPANASDLAGKIALIDRANCNFTVKVKNAQDAGAAAVIMVNNLPDAALVTMGGDDNTITIPAVFISYEDGQLIKDQLADGAPVTATLKLGVAIDGDYDAGVICHEYTHGISNRLTGGPATASCLNNAEQMGEGWSDFYGLMATTDWSKATVADATKPRGIGTYVVGQNTSGVGIRTYPYTTDMGANPWTLGVLNTTGEAHVVGELWCSMLWDMVWELVKQKGITPNLFDATATGGNVVALRLVTEGMKIQPCSPGFVDGRNAILEADTLLYGGAHSCAIWKAFARRGMGLKASQGSSNVITDQVPDYETPTSIKVEKTANVDSLGAGQTVTYTVKTSCTCSNIVNAKIYDTLSPALTYVSSDGSYNAATRVITFDVPNVIAGQTKTFTVTATLNGGNYFAAVEHLNDPANDAAIPATYTNVGWTSTTARRHSVTRSYFALSVAAQDSKVLTTATGYPIKGITTLEFWHYYNTEAGWDGGVVEISTNGGSTWQDLGPYMTLNGYNSYISSTNLTTIAGRKAFTGSSNGVFLNTKIDLTMFSGKTAYFRFKADCDLNTIVDGWYVDDIILKSQAGVGNQVTVVDVDGATAATDFTTTFIKTEVVPLTWLSFTAEKRGVTSQLVWQTASEINTASFVVERSHDGTHFENLGTVAANGLSSIQKYQFNDAKPHEGINYYRIKQLDKDGKSSFSITKTIYFGKGGFSIAPNPANSYIYVNVPVAAAGKSMLTLIDAEGRILKEYALVNESNQLRLPVLPPGLYNVRIVHSGNVYNQKLVIQ